MSTACEMKGCMFGVRVGVLRLWRVWRVLLGWEGMGEGVQVEMPLATPPLMMSGRFVERDQQDIRLHRHVRWTMHQAL